MATVTQFILTDSLDERVKTGVKTVTFFHPVFGTKHEIELSEKNREHFAAHLAKLDKYIDASREIIKDPVKPTKPAGAKSDLSAVREWAKANGYTVGDRGRIKADILEAYDAAHMPTAVEEDKVVLIVSPEAQVKLEEIAANKDVDASNLVEVEFPHSENTEPVELTDAEVLELMDNLDKAGQDVSLENLTEAVKA